MYKIIGADGKEYGPVTLEQLRQWINEGRANAQTKVSLEGSADWKPLAEYPELAAHLPAGGAPAIPPGPPPLRPTTAYSPAPGVNQPYRGDAASQVSGPAVGLIVVAVINFLSSAFSVLAHLMGLSMMNLQNLQNMPSPAFANLFSGTFIVVSSVINVLVGVVILMGGLKMKALQSHGLAVTAAILAALPCTSGCCLIGLPVGIWALVILFRPEVKSAFH